MSKALGIVDTTIGKKLTMALSGTILFGFVLGHMLGNLQLFVSAQSFNEYSAFLHSTPALTWTTRVAVFVSAVLHFWSAYALWWNNRKARPVGYKRIKYNATSYAARTMVWTGPIVLLYVAYHLAHLTFGVTEGLGYGHDPVDVYTNVVQSFRIWPIAALYAAANVALGVHLYHGAWSMLQTLGVSHPRYNDLLRSVAVAVGLVVATGFVAIPAGVLADHHGLIEVLP